MSLPLGYLGSLTYCTIALFSVLTLLRSGRRTGRDWWTVVLLTALLISVVRLAVSHAAPSPATCDEHRR